MFSINSQEFNHFIIGIINKHYFRETESSLNKGDDIESTNFFVSARVE